MDLTREEVEDSIISITMNRLNSGPCALYYYAIFVLKFVLDESGGGDDSEQEGSPTRSTIVT